jgi:acetylornithine/N-succinyldiaminopimelate aminotransferase
VLRFVPSLIMPLDDMSEGFERLTKAFAEIAGATAPAASR